MSHIEVPENDPKAPRWLLDLEKWKIKPYTKVPRDILEREGYGVVSYTWGYIANWKSPVPASEKPEGVIWTVPTTSKWTLSEAREIMRTIETRYIWWDWMCVPQVQDRSLGDELYDAKGQEIGKQLHIYRNARKSIVWLHSTSWEEDSALKQLLLLEMTRPGFIDPDTVRKHTTDVEQWIKGAQKDERWLESGWTLQEGVLLGDTYLIDGNGKAFLSDRFYNGKQAIVRDMSIPISVLAHNLASAYFIQVEGHDPSPERPGAGQFGYLLPKSPESAIWVRRAVKILVESGLVFFFWGSPLYILAGKQSREYSYYEDSCWSLIGAMEIENVKVQYKVPMDLVKKRFLSALIEKSQWEILLLPFPECRVRERQEDSFVERDFRWLSIADGALLPVSLFLVEEHTTPGTTEDNLPKIIFSDENFSSEDLRLQAKDRQTISLFRATRDDVTYFRHYRQNKDGLRIVSSRVVDFAEDVLFETSWLLPLWDVDTKDGVIGKRCVLLLRLKDQITNQPVHAAFGGIIDIWGTFHEKVDVDQVLLDPPL